MIKIYKQSSYKYLIKKTNNIQQLIKSYKKKHKEIKLLNKKYKFFSISDFGYIKNQLTKLDLKKKKKNLFLVPIGVKDVFNTRNLKTEFGSSIFKNFIPGNNSRLVDIIAENQGIIVGKTTTAEFAVHYFPETSTINPHNKKHITGTSSAGSAVAVACGALPVALGTQTAGSIIRPASFCGVIGFKPSFGALDRTGVLKTSDTLDTIGLFSSNLSILNKTFQTLIQAEDQYPYSKNYFKKIKNKKKFTIGIISDCFSGYKNYDEEVKKDFELFCEKYLNKHNIVKNLDFNFINKVHENHENIYCKSLAYYFKSLGKRKKKFSKVMKSMIKKGNTISTKQYLESCITQENLTNKFQNIMENYDFLVTPSTGSAAPTLNKSEKKDTSLIWTFFGAPSISLPIFYCERSKLPFGLQIVSSRYSDLSLISFSKDIMKLINNKNV